MAQTYGITDESQMIDLQGVQAACTKICEAAHDFTTSAQKVDDAKGYCGKGALEVEGKTMEDSFDQVRDALGQVEKSIIDFANSIQSTANSIWSQQYNELQEYRAQVANSQNQQ